MSQVAPLNIRVVKTTSPITVSSAAGGDGQTVTNTDKSLYIALRNVDTEDCEYKVNNGSWYPLRTNSAANLDISLDTTTVYLRKAPHGRDTYILLDVVSAVPEYLVGDDAVPLAGTTPVEGAGVHYNASPAANVAAFNAALQRRGVVTLSTPGQYIFGDPEQGGLLIPRNTTLIIPDDGSVELILADNIFEPLIRAERQFDPGIAAVGTIGYSGSGANIYGTVTAAPADAIHLKHPVGSWIAILGLDLSLGNNRSYQGVYQVSSVAENSITYEMATFPPSGGASTVGARVYPADTGIRIIGGLWDGNGANNRTGSPYYQGDPHTHVLSFRNVQNLIVRGVQLRRGNSWSIGTNNIRDCTFRDLYGDLYGDGSGNANAIIQGSGGARNVLIDGVGGTCEDNMVAWSLDHIGQNRSGTAPGWTYQDHWYGDVYDLRIRNVHTNKSNAAPVMFWGNSNAKYHSVTVDGVTGRANATLVGIDNGFDYTDMFNACGSSFKIKNVHGESNAALVSIRSDGTWDHIEIDGIHQRRPANLPCVSFSKRTSGAYPGTAQTIKRLDIRNCSAYIQGSTNNRTYPIIEISDTNITDLRISGLPLMRINAAVGMVSFWGTEGVIGNAVISDIAGQAVITGDTCLVKCANTGANALGQLTLRDAVLTGFDATGGLVHQTTTGRVTKVVLDNCKQTLGEAPVILDNVTNPAIVYQAQFSVVPGAPGVYLMAPGSGVTPTVAGTGTGWSVTSSAFDTVNGEQWYKVVMTGTGGGVGQLDLTLTGLRPFAADSLQVEYMADHSQGGPLTANLSVDTNFTTSVGVYTNGRNMTAPNSGDPLMHAGRNSATWTKGGMTVQGASFVISAVEPVIGKPWTGVRIRRAINNLTGTMTFWLRSVRAGVNARKGRLAVMADDGYHSWFRLGVPILARYGIVSTAAIIPSGVGVNTSPANGNATLDEIRAYVRAGNFVVGHGPNSGDASLFLGSLAGGAERTADRVADMVISRDYILANGLAGPAGAACYVWPQGTYNLGSGDTGLLDAAYSAGFRLARCATAYPLLLQKIDALSPQSHSRLTVPIIGHTYAGTTNSPDNAAETTNINNIIGYIQKIAEGGCDGVLMLHRVVNRGTATAGGIEIETDRLAALCAAIQTLMAAGTLECVGFEQLA